MKNNRIHILNNESYTICDFAGAMKASVKLGRRTILFFEDSKTE